MSVQPGVASADTILETARYFQSGTETVFAVHTAPLSAPADVGVILAHSGVNNFSAHRNGVWTTISRRLAAKGIPSLRFDFAGTGESSGQFTLRIGGQPAADTEAAMDALRAAGCRRLLVVGSCFGSVPSVVAAAARADVAGLILLSPPLVNPDAGGAASLLEKIREVVNWSTIRTVATNAHYRRWYFARLASLVKTRVAVRLSELTSRTRPSASQPGEQPNAGTAPSRGLLLESELARLVTTGSHVEVVYGTVDGNLTRVESDPAAARAIRLLRDRPVGLTWTVLDGSVHGLEDIIVQEELIRIIVQRALDLAEQAPAATH